MLLLRLIISFPINNLAFVKVLVLVMLSFISDKVQRALDSSFEARMVGLEFSAAFDRVNHNALIYKLRQLSIGGPFLNILMDFLLTESNV